MTPRRLIPIFLVIILNFAAPALVSAASNNCSGGESEQFTVPFGSPNISISTLLRPYHSYLFKLVDHSELGRVDWYVNGEKKQSEAIDAFCFTPTRAENTKLQVFFSQVESTIEIPIEVASFKNIILLDAIPNSVGSDSRSEQIALSNSNPFSVTLSHWQLRSRTSSTVIPIDIMIPAKSSVVVMASSKLNNSAGAYDLFNESNQLVDSLVFKNPDEGSLLIRDGIFWDDGSQEKTKTTSSNTEEIISISGLITLPQGKTFDIKTDAGDMVHVVIHTSWQGIKPTFHKGDRVAVTGLWRRSSRGPYVSVRLGHSVLLLAAADTKKKDAGTRVGEVENQSTINLRIATAQAANSARQNIHKPTGSIGLNPWLDGLFAFMITGGVFLCIRTRKLFSPKVIV